MYGFFYFIYVLRINTEYKNTNKKPFILVILFFLGNKDITNTKNAKINIQTISLSKILESVI